MRTQQHRSTTHDATDRPMNDATEQIAFSRTYAPPLEGVRTIPDSSFAEQDNTLLGLEFEEEEEREARVLKKSRRPTGHQQFSMTRSDPDRRRSQ